jgi:TetR/AcrR family transcriptional regulator, transcriptional repressor for nem operon
MRDSILKIAEEQMKAGGYGLLSFGQIAKELDTSRANLHYHFKNKETLATEVTKRFIKDQEADLINLTNHFTNDFAGLINAFEQFLWLHHESQGRVGACVCAQIIRQPECPDSLLRLAKKHFNGLKSILLEQVINGQKKGILRADVEPMVIATEAGCMIAGLAQMALFTTDNELEQIKGASLRWAEHYILKL